MFDSILHFAVAFLLGKGSLIYIKTIIKFCFRSKKFSLWLRLHLILSIIVKSSSWTVDYADRMPLRYFCTSLLPPESVFSLENVSGLFKQIRIWSCISLVHIRFEMAVKGNKSASGLKGFLLREDTTEETPKQTGSIPHVPRRGLSPSNTPSLQPFFLSCSILVLISPEPPYKLHQNLGNFLKTSMLPWGMHWLCQSLLLLLFHSFSLSQNMHEDFTLQN